MNFNDELKKRVDEVNSLMEETLSKDTGLAEPLMDAMRYSVLAPGKRLRPIFMRESALLFSDSLKDIPELKYFMAAIELIHSYSLVHDDMPCIDNDEYRRGRKTTHAVYGETNALLAGDGLLNFAYETASLGLLNAKHLDRAARALAVLSKKAGIFGMVGGQAVDVESEKTGKEITKERLIFIHENKTAALIEASMMIGAILSGASDKDIEVIEEAASKIGIAFQIRDDILDVEGSFEELGKPIGSDEENEKATYVTLFGLEKAKGDVEEYSKRAMDILNSFDRKNEFLMELVNSLIARNR